MDMTKQVLSTSQVAELLGVTKGSVVNWINQGQLLAGQTPGGHKRVAVEDLLEFIRRQKLPVPAGLSPSRPRVLIVDDDADIRELIAAEIEAEYPDYEVLQAQNGFVAGERIGTAKPDVVILDLRMPGLDGYEVCRWIKSSPDTMDTGVIAITAYPSPGAEKRIIACGARICLSKPLDMAVLLQEVDAAVRERKRSSRIASVIQKQARG
jgi:excisionase family DNA binding protein